MNERYVNLFQPGSLLFFLRENLSCFRGFLIWRVVSVVVVAPFPLITQRLIDDGVEPRLVPVILAYTALSVALLAVHVFSMWRATHLLSERTQSLIHMMRARIFDKLQFIHFGFLDSTQLGRMLSKYAFDTNNVETCLIMLLTNFVPEIIRSALIIAVLGWVNPWLLVFVALSVPVFAIIRLNFFDSIERSNREVRLAREKLTGQANEFISAIKLVRGFGQEAHARTAMDEVSTAYADTRRDQMAVNQTLGYVVFSLYTGIGIAALAFGGVMVANELLSIGALLALVGALPIILNPINLFSTVSAQYFLGQESYRSIKELVDSGYVEKWRGTKVLRPVRGEIEFRNVSFRYNDDSPLVLDQISLFIPSGQNVALVGPSGSGKSSIVNLLLGLYSPTSGEILIDGVRQEDLAIRDFRRQCAIVMQDNILLSGTLRENLRFGRPDASESEIVQAALDANAWDFIQQLPKGLDTPVGERGVSLSGGQRQRIAIARALLRNPRILILDEATSALDYESEALVQEAIERISRGRTTITIAHRLSTIRHVERIIFLRAGKIIEDGSYDSLAGRKDSEFAAMLAAQDARSQGNLLSPD